MVLRQHGADPGVPLGAPCARQAFGCQPVSEDADCLPVAAGDVDAAKQVAHLGSYGLVSHALKPHDGFAPSVGLFGRALGLVVFGLVFAPRFVVEMDAVDLEAVDRRVDVV
jgi:hypothetical protein